MTNLTVEDVLALEALDTKLRAILPEQYRDTYEDVLPVSMGSAGLKYDADGRVAWDEIWSTFCDLAMAGGPPHRGSLLEPSETTNDKLVENEIARGIVLITGLEIQPSNVPGWIGVRCTSVGMAGWLVRAIVMENIMARHEREVLYLPVGPNFRLAKEIKNVITTMAKTCHYWTEHMPPEQHQAIDALFSSADSESELLTPMPLHEVQMEVQADPASYRERVAGLAHEITARTGRTCFANRYVGWIGIDFPTDRAAIWMMRAMVVENILARREGSVLFLPVTRKSDRLLDTFERVQRLQAFVK